FDGFDEQGEDVSVSCKADALVLFNPVIDLEPGYGWEGGARKLGADWRSLSPLHNLHENMPATIIFHGTEDDTAPIVGAQRFCSVLQDYGVDADLVEFEGAGHGFFNAGKFENAYADTLQKMEQFFDKIGFTA
ncbi:MAG: prolyl oligopeptidase family serine peptidase, partial [Planctomycetes bacterium]|nr:prolyl oligopeptidase family serine peptidase [Planctomycetota bacterium]